MRCLSAFRQQIRIGSLLLALCLLSAKGFSAQVAPEKREAPICSKYHVPELRKLCALFDADNIEVHTSVPDNRLSPLVESWGTTPKLHIIPAGVYTVDKLLILYAGQGLLPHPVSPPARDKTWRTIELVPSAGFKPPPLFLTILLQYDQSHAGGIEIHANEHFFQVETFKKAREENKAFSLVQIIFTSKVTLAGSYLTETSGYSQSLPVRVSGSSCGAGSVQLQRNLILAEHAAAGVSVSTAQSNQQLTMSNSLLSIRNAESSGVTQTGGKLVVTNNVFLVNNSDDGNYKAADVRIKKPVDLVVTGNSFLSPGLSVLAELSNEDHDSDNNDSRGDISGNSFHPDATAFAKGYFDDDGQFESSEEGIYIASALYANGVVLKHPLQNPGVFFCYQGLLGANAIPVQWLAYVNSNTSSVPREFSAQSCPDLSRYQISVTMNNTDARVYSPGQALDHYPAEPECNHYGPTPAELDNDGAIALSVSMGMWFLLTPANLIVSCVAAHCYIKHYRSYTPLDGVVETK